jgi:hypothetical protein
LILGAGRSSLRLAPPLVIDEYDVDTAVRMIDEILSEVGGEVAGPGSGVRGRTSKVRGSTASDA